MSASEEAPVNPAFLVLAVLFAIAGFQEARRFQRQYGETPWRWDPWVWAVVMFLSWVIGVILLAIAERQGRNRAARQPAYSGGYVPQVPTQPSYAQSAPVYAGQPALVAAAPTAALPAAMWAADPTGRHQYRWWDGATWTPNVATNGVVGQDPV